MPQPPALRLAEQAEKREQGGQEPQNPADEGHPAKEQADDGQYETCRAQRVALRGRLLHVDNARGFRIHDLASELSRAKLRFSVRKRRTNGNIITINASEKAFLSEKPV